MARAGIRGFRLPAAVAGLWLFTACGRADVSLGLRVGAMAVADGAGGDVDVEFVLVDPEGEPADVELAFSRDGGATWQTGTVKSGAAGLGTSVAGARHRLVWDALQDLGPRAYGEISLTLGVRGSSSTGRIGSPMTAPATLANLPAAARRVESYMIHFGAMDPATIAIAEAHDLVVLNSRHPSVTRAVVAQIQDGVDPVDPQDDVMVLGYVNVGEDERTIGIGDSALLLDPRFVGNGTGPRVDPRGPGAAGQPVTGLDPLGLPSVSGGYASFYLDDKSVANQGVGDGRPDRNDVTGACYVNMGDPAWFAALETMQSASPDGRSGFRELLTLNYGLGLGCDGVCLDNVDTCAPDSWTGAGDPDQAEFEWTAAGYTELVERLRTAYPGALILQNRGLFFFHPDLPQYAVSPGALLDFVKIENYRLDSDPSRLFDLFTFADNKFNFAPKLQAEANRTNGFQVLSLGYAEGPGIAHDTLLGRSTLGLAVLLHDIVEAQDLAGFRHYLVDAGGQLANRFVLDHANSGDQSPPVWTSTYNDQVQPYPTPPGAPTPRIGIQQAVGGSQWVRVRWDVALDQNPVAYVVYYDDQPFDLNRTFPFLGAARRVLQPEPGLGYHFGAAPGIYANEAVITGLAAGTTYYFCIHAVDSVGNEDDNEVVLSARTLDQALLIQIDGNLDDWRHLPWALTDNRDNGDSGGPDWKQIEVVNDEVNLYVHYKVHDRFNLDGAPQHAKSQFRILIDLDDNPFTGFAFSNIGSEVMVLGDQLVLQRAGIEHAGVLAGIAINPKLNIQQGELAVPLAQLDAQQGGVVTKIRMIFVDAAVNDTAPDSGYFAYEIVR